MVQHETCMTKNNNKRRWVTMAPSCSLVLAGLSFVSMGAFGQSGSPAPGGISGVEGRRLGPSSTVSRDKKPSLVMPKYLELLQDRELLRRFPNDVSGENGSLPIFATRSGLSRSVPRSYPPAQVTPTGDDGISQGPVVRELGKQAGMTDSQVAAALAGTGANRRTDCSIDVVEELNHSRTLVANSAGNGEGFVIGPDERLARYLREKTRETGGAAIALQRFEVAWRRVLSACFRPPTGLPQFEAIRSRIGAFQGPGDSLPWCTGLLLADGVILSARHCFFDSESGLFRSAATAEGVQFKLADESAALPVALSQFDQRGATFNYWDDQILVQVPKSGKLYPALTKSSSLVALGDSPIAWQNRTELMVFGIVPLARALNPTDYPSGLAAPRVEGCYVAFKGSDCVTHMCSVVPGASGSSIFTADTGRWVGLHIGPEDKYKCSPLVGSFTTNIAATELNAEIRIYFNEAK